MTFAFAGAVGTIFSFLGKLLICVGNTLIIYACLVYIPEYFHAVSSPIGPCFFVFVISYIIATLFMNIYTTTALCLLHCLFADVDICSQEGMDYMENSARPPEMEDLVTAIAKPRPVRPHSDSQIN